MSDDFAGFVGFITLILAGVGYALLLGSSLARDGTPAVPARGPRRGVSLGLAVFGGWLVLPAWWLADHLCAGDGTVVIGTHAVHQEALCRRLDLPGLPTTLASALCLLALVGAAVVCVVHAARLRPGWRAFGAGLAGLAIGCLSVYAALTATNVTFDGYA